jgi:hypothetical protein
VWRDDDGSKRCLSQVRELRLHQRLLLMLAWPVSARASARASALGLSLLFAPGCVGKLLTVRIEQEGSTVVPGAGLVGGVLGALSLGGFDDLSVNVDQELANQGVEPGDIASVHVVELSLSTPDAPDMAFIDTLEVDIGSEGMDTVRIAHLEDFPEGEPDLDMVLDDEDLTAYVVADSLQVTTDASGSAPEDDTTINVFMALEVQATVSGAAKQVDK